MRLAELTPAIRNAYASVSSVLYRAGTQEDGPLRNGVAKAYRIAIDAHMGLHVPTRKDLSYNWEQYVKRTVDFLNDLAEEMKETRDRKRLESYYDIRRDALAHETYIKLQALVQALEEAVEADKED